MIIHPTSDWHRDIANNEFKRSVPTPECDVIVVSGDVMAPGDQGIRAVREYFEDTAAAIVFVPGNHCFYSHADRKRPELKTTWERQRQELMPKAAEETGIILLDDATCEIDGVLFVGATLWSDFAARPDYMTLAEAQHRAMAMNDYRLIKTGRGRGKDRLTPAQTIAAHMTSRMFIADALMNKQADQDAVVITHHAPSFRSLRGYDPAAPNDFNELDWCYGSDLEYLMNSESAPILWVHGHLHDQHDYVCGATRVVCNARGYPDFSRRENPRFDPTLVIEIEPRPTLTMGMR